MPTNSALADASTAAFVATIVIYAVAMFGYAVEYAFGRKATAARTEPKVLATIGADKSQWTIPDEYRAAAGGSEITDHERDEPATPTGNQAGVTPRQAVLAGRIATVAMVTGAVVHAATLVLRAAAVGRWPWGNMFEFIVAACLVGVVAWTVVVLRGLAARRLGLFTMLLVVLLLGVSTRVYTEATPLVPALNSYWIAIHVSAAVISTGVFMVGFVFAVLHLIRRHYHRLTSDGRAVRFPFTIAPKLPVADRLEKLTWRLHILAFPLWTFGIIAGAIWAREAWSRYWGWDPKEIWAFVAWVVYAAYLHSRATGATGRRFAPWIVVLGWAVMLFNLFGVNLVFNGLHSYAGV